MEDHCSDTLNPKVVYLILLCVWKSEIVIHSSFHPKLRDFTMEKVIWCTERNQLYVRK